MSHHRNPVPDFSALSPSELLEESRKTLLHLTENPDKVVKTYIDTLLDARGETHGKKKQESVKQLKVCTPTELSANKGSDGDSKGTSKELNNLTNRNTATEKEDEGGSKKEKEEEDKATSSKEDDDQGGSGKENEDDDLESSGKVKEDEDKESKVSEEEGEYTLGPGEGEGGGEEEMELEDKHAGGKKRRFMRNDVALHKEHEELDKIDPALLHHIWI
jgi:hypothetical protein